MKCLIKLGTIFILIITKNWKINVFWVINLNFIIFIHFIQNQKIIYFLSRLRINKFLFKNIFRIKLKKQKWPKFIKPESNLLWLICILLLIGSYLLYCSVVYSNGCRVRVLMLRWRRHLLMMMMMLLLLLLALLMKMSRLTWLGLLLRCRRWRRSLMMIRRRRTRRWRAYVIGGRQFGRHGPTTLPAAHSIVHTRRILIVATIRIAVLTRSACQCRGKQRFVLIYLMMQILWLGTIFSDYRTSWWLQL